MKIGIFLGYGPQVTLGKEGLGRYLAGLIKGFQDRGEEICIACPHWLLKTMDALFKDFSIDKSSIQILETGRTPILWRVYSLLHRQKKKNKRFQRFVEAAQSFLKKYADRMARINSVAAFLLMSIPPVLFGIAAIIPSAIAYLLFLLLKLFRKMESRIRNKLSQLIVYFRRIGLIPDIGKAMLRTFRQMNMGEIEKLVQAINAEEPMDVWFVPAIFWPQVTNIQNSTVVINAPDLVSEKFAQGFADVLNADHAIGDCRKTLTHGRYFITYCEYLRRSLLVEEYGKSAACTVAIPHVNNAMDGYLYIDPALKDRMGIEKDLALAYAGSLLPVALMNASCRPAYKQGFSMEKVPYIFYASQARPSKNIMNLVKAYEYLLRHRFIHHKLVLTCKINGVAELNRYILDHGLQNEVIGLWNVPAKVLAALYKCADLVVNPTLYEGGFPFTFGEGMSVGTPSLMSDIPQVREVLEPAGLEEIMFDPYDWKAMAEKIEWGIRNKEALYCKELPLYEKMAQRTPEVVAEEYIEAFKRFVQLDGRQIGGMNEQ